MKSSIKFWRCPAQLLERKQRLLGKPDFQEMHGTFPFGGQNSKFELCECSLFFLFKFSVVVASVAGCQLSVVSVCRFGILLHCFNDFAIF